MVYAERYIGFWLAYALPTFLFFVAPLVLIACKKRYILTPPTVSVTSRAFSLLGMASKSCWSPSPIQTYKNFQREGFWDQVKPSVIRARGGEYPSWMNEIDDAWVEQVARGFSACKVRISFCASTGSELTGLRCSSGCRCTGLHTTKL